MSNKNISIILAVIFFLVGLFTLPHYGINWDTINHLPRGQAYLHFFLTGRKDYSDLLPWKQYFQDPDTLWIKTDVNGNKITARSIYQSDATTFNWFMDHDGNGHPPVSDILSSFFNLVFFQKLKVINDIDSYRVYGVFLASTLVGLVYFWVSSLYGKFAGLISSFSLSLYPLFWSESHFNTEKDIPETVFWSFMFYFLWRGFTKKSGKWIALSGVFFGLALGTKFNILFSFIPIFIWVFLYLIKNLGYIKKSIFPLIVSFVLGITIFIGSWPYLWADPLARVYKVFKFYKSIGLTTNVDPRFVGPFHINTYPMYWILYTTPIVILFLFVIGVVVAVKRLRRDQSLTYLFFLLWLATPIVRVIWPGTTIYGGTRQIMEYIPPLAIIAGIGGKYLREWISRFSGNRISYLVVLLLFVPITLKLVEIHPNENVYFNSLIGGLKGAKAKKIPFWGNSFGASYRQGVSWIDKNAEKGARVVLAYELLPNIPSIFLRSDIDYHNSWRSGYLREGEYAITLTYDGTDERSYYDSYLTKFLNPVYEFGVDGVSVVRVWKNDVDHLKVPWDEEVVVNVSYKKQESGLIFDLKKMYKISRLEIDYNEAYCSKLSSGVVRISKDGKKWENLPGVLPNSWRISHLGQQPLDGHFIEPFVGQEVRYIDLVLSPSDTCLKNIRSFKVYQLVQDL